jgi:ESS family glutamate:Na+ symporter
MQLQLAGLETLVLALVTIELGRRLNRRVGWLERGNIPPAVSAGLPLSLAFAALRQWADVDLQFATAPRDNLLLLFFASLGFGAHLRRLASAGRGVVVMCLAITAAIAAQNLVGLAIVSAFGEPPALGLFCGSISFLGGHGTAVAWSQSLFGKDIEGAMEVGLGAATLGLVLGGLAAGPVAMWLATKSPGKARRATIFARGEKPPRHPEPPFSSDRWLVCLLLLLGCMWAGTAAHARIVAAGIEVPAFLAVMLCAVLVTNAADLLGRPVDAETVDLVGTICLRVFLAIAMLSLNWTALADHLGMLLAAALAQVVAISLIGILLVYLLFGRGKEGATAAGGFIGFSLGAMPVGLAVMRRLQESLGEAPRAILSITLAASLFTDLTNALVLTWLFGVVG